MIQLKVTTIGNSTGVILNKEALAKLNVSKGDTLILTESPEGYILTRHNEEFERQMKIAEDFVHRYQDTLRELAK
jgi:putative addiction module antidote